MKCYSQLPELHHLTCRSLGDLTSVTFLYRWLSPCFTSSTLTVRSVPTGYTRTVFPRLAWEGLSAAGYTTPPTYEVSEFERLGVPVAE
jgi:hypothetical protein